MYLGEEFVMLSRVVRVRLIETLRLKHRLEGAEIRSGL